MSRLFGHRHMGIGRVSTFFLTFMWVVPCVYAQPSGEDSTQIVLDDLRTPAAPGFVLLGHAPSAVERPETPKAFAVSLLNAANQSDLIPDNYAIEVAPYWLVPHPSLTFQQRYQANVGQTILQSLSLSLATSRISELTDTSAVEHVVSFGLRTQVLDGVLSSQMQNARDKLRIELQVKQLILALLPDGAANIQELKQGVLSTFQELEANPALLTIRGLSEDEKLQKIESMKRDILAYLSNKDASNAEEVELVLHDLQQIVTSDIRGVVQKLRDTSKRPVGWIWELAGAAAWNFRNNDFDTSDLIRGGLWTTLSYRLQKPLIDFILVGRYLRNEAGMAKTNDFDIGGRILYQYNKLGISAELLKRFKENAENTQRIVGIVEYVLSEDTYVTASFGKDEDLIGNGSLVSLIGVNLGFGQKAVIDPTRIR